MSRTLLVSQNGVKTLRPAAATRLRYTQQEVGDPAKLADAMAWAQRGGEDALRDGTLFRDARVVGPIQFTAGTTWVYRHGFKRPAHWLVTRWQSVTGTNPHNLNEVPSVTSNDAIGLVAAFNGTAFLVVF